MASSTLSSGTADVSLAALAARAATLDERFASGWQPVRTPAGDARAEVLLARWEKLLPGGGEAGLAERLVLANWTRRRVLARLGDGRWRAGAPLPEWTGTWAAVREAMPGNGPPAAPGGAETEEADDLWKRFFAPFVDVGEARLRAKARRGGFALDDLIVAEFRRLLGLRLGRTAQPVLEFEFGVWREARRGGTAWLGGGEGEAATRAEFAAELGRTGAAMLERNCPVLLRQCCEQVQQLGAAWAEFAGRLAMDAAGLAARFGVGGRAPGELVRCRGGLSDPHRGARTVVELHFAGGARLVYKPRPMALEAGYFALAAWLEARGLRLRLGGAGVWDRGEYGWMEWIEAAPCASRAAAQRHFVRTGAHLALLQVLGGADFHSENWMAAGEFPLPIDLEVLLRPSAPGMAGELEQSVLGVGLLPVWQAAGGRVANISALGEVAREGDAARGDGAHRARFAGEALAAGNFVDEIVEGFCVMHAALRRHRAALVAAGGPLARLRRARLRHVARPTEIYAGLLGVATQPRALADGAAGSIELERLAKALAGVPGSEARKLMRMIAAEQRALAKLDVPLLHGRVNGLALETGEGPEIARFFVVSGWTACRRRLAALDVRETRRQADLIRAAFAVARLGRVDTRPQTAKRGGGTPMAGPGPQPASRAALLAAARAIGRELAGQAVAIKGGVTWVAPQLLPRVERFQLAMLNLGLYDGVAGVGVFFAALHRATGEAQWARLAHGALAPIVTALGDPAARRHVRRMPAGVGLGRGGLVYALVTVAEWLGQPAWLARKQRLVELLAPQAGEADWDVMSGAAGAIFAALRLAEATRDRAAILVASEWGRRLAAAQAAMPAGGRAWRHDGAALGGMAHGAAGVAAALARLAAATGERTFRQAAEDAVAFEAGLFVAERGNWLDLRGASDLAEARRAGRCGLAWCHGAPGILLARLAGLQGLDTTGVRGDIAAALATITAAPAGEIDQCCCGEAGVIDILASAAGVLARPELMEMARRRAAALLAKARGAGGYNAFGGAALPAGPGFFQGRAGIGYTWLRLAQPERFPSVLAFA